MGNPQSSPFLPLFIGQLENRGLVFGANDMERSLLSSELPTFTTFSRVSESGVRSYTCDPAKYSLIFATYKRRNLLLLLQSVRRARHVTKSEQRHMLIHSRQCFTGQRIKGRFQSLVTKSEQMRCSIHPAQTPPTVR